MLLAANRHIQFGGGFARQYFSQPLDHRCRKRCVNHKVRTCETEDDTGLGLTGQAGIDKQGTGIAVMDRQQERIDRIRHPQLTYQPGSLVTVKELIGNLERRPRQLLRAKALLQRQRDVINITRQVFPR
ncbi:hypothetical protein D3C71_1593340 [compost metagenome]